jgi:hypothetical protein
MSVLSILRIIRECPTCDHSRDNVARIAGVRRHEIVKLFLNSLYQHVSITSGNIGDKIIEDVEK